MFSLHEEQRLPIKFAFPREVGSPDPTPEHLCLHFFPDNFIDEVAEASRKYVSAKMTASDLRRKDIESGEILRFFSSIAYMGAVRLSSRKDYFHPPNGFPRHTFLDGFSYDRFTFIWLSSFSYILS